MVYARHKLYIAYYVHTDLNLFLQFNSITNQLRYVGYVWNLTKYLKWDQNWW